MHFISLETIHFDEFTGLFPFRVDLYEIYLNP